MWSALRINNGESQPLGISIRKNVSIEADEKGLNQLKIPYL